MGVLAACGGDDDEAATAEPTQCDEEADDCEDDAPSQVPAVELVEAFPGVTFDAPVAVSAVPGSSGAYVVLERTGLIFRVDHEGKEQIGDLRPIPLAGESGLWNIAFSPNFEENNQVYLYYGVDADPSDPAERIDVAGELSRFDFDRLTPAAATSILTVTDIAGRTNGRASAVHNGGGLAFGPDGYLYLGVGDGGPQGDPRQYGQDLTKLAGKVLRLDTENVEDDGDLVAQDNPFAATPGCADGCDEIFAYGFRNPWRLSFDDHGELWVADVGRADFEEVNLVEVGGNYGWSIMEGPECHRALDCDETGLAPPVASYPHGEDRGAITGGFVYGGDGIPGLAGYYVYGDFENGTIRATLASDPFTTFILLETDLAVVSFAEDANGEILVVNIADARGGGGAIYRLVALN